MQERLGQIGEYWLSKRSGSDCWCRTWFDASTRQTRRASLGASDLEEAKLALWEWYAKHGRLTKQEASDTPLELVLVRYYQRHAEGLASADMARIALAYWSDFWAGSMVTEVTAARQREFLAWMESQGKSQGYIKRILTVGKAALTMAYKEGEITSVPYIIPGQDSPPRELVLSIDQSKALWAAAKQPHERMFLALAYGTLSRPEAILELHRGSADFSRRLLTTNPPGRRQTKKYRPVVPIGEFLLPWLEQAEEGPLVTWHGKPIDSFKTAWRRMRKEAKLPKDAVPKTIRHTMATELRAADVPEAEIQGFLGHRAYGGKTEIYAKYRPDYLGKAVAAIDGYMGKLRVSCVLENTKATRQEWPK